MNEKKDWFDVGFGGIEEAEKRMMTAHRFWVPINGRKEFVFLDDEPFCIMEHSLYLEGSWRNYYTCLKGMYDTCPFCEDGKKPYYIGFLTVVDLSEWTDNQGQRRSHEIRLFPMKTRPLKRFRRRKEEMGSLVGCVFRAYRDSDRDPVVGGEFEFVRKVDLKDLVKEVMEKNRWVSSEEQIAPFDYKEILRPVSPEQAVRVLSRLHGEAAEPEGTADVPEGTEIPF